MSKRYLANNESLIKKALYLRLMAEDIARVIPLVEDRGGIFNVCDSYHPSFGELSTSVARQLGKRRPFNMPLGVAKCLAKIGDMMGGRAPINSLKLKKMTSSLTFSNEKARRELGWDPLDVLENYKV